MANTNILIKRSNTTSSPGSLLAGELAYSYQSNTAYIGTPTGDGVVKIGGQAYTSQIDNATSAATGNTLVKRDSTGNASFNFVTANYFAGTFTGNSDTATALQTPRDFSIDGSDVESSTVSFDGTGNVVLQGNLKTTGVVSGTYGGQTEIPVITVDDKGRISYAANVSVATTLDINGDTGGPSTVDLLSQTLTVSGGDGVTSTVSGQSITLDVDTTVVRANTPITLQTIDGSLEVSGNLTVLGTQVTVNTETLNIADPLLYLAANNYYSDVVDIGFVGNYNDGSTNRHAGVFRNAGNKEFYIFDNYDKEPESNDIDVADASFHVANVHANLISGFINTGIATIGTANVTNNIGVTGNIYNTGSIKTSSVLFNGTTASVDGTSGNLVLTAGSGGLDGIQFAGNAYLLGPNGARNAQLNYSGTSGLFGIYNAKVYSGASSSSNTTGALVVDGGVGIKGTVNADTLNLRDALTVANGGTGAKSFTSGSLIIGNGTGALASLANTTYSLTGSLSSSKTITSLTVDPYGRVTAATGEDIAIGAGQVSGLSDIATSGSASDILSGTLAVSYGGTGLNTITQYGITYGNGTSSVGVTAAAGTADQSWSNQILTTTNAGVPVWTTALDGGTF